MLQKIAIISDIHGNLEALKAVLNDAKIRGVDKIICLGDIIAKGSHASECIKLVRDNCDVVIRGNCDRHFTTDYNMEEVPEKEKRRLLWNRSQINDEEKEYLHNLPFSYEFYMSGSLVRVFHATPYKDNIAVDTTNDFETKYGMFVGTDKTVSDKTADIVIFGHIHHCFAERFYNRTLLNAGSVGNTHDIIRNDDRDADVRETTQAVYLIIEGKLGEKAYGASSSWQFIRLPYNIDKELDGSRDNLEYNEFMYELRYGRYRNMKKVYNNLKKAGVNTDLI